MKQNIASFFDSTYLSTAQQLNITEEENLEKVKQVVLEAIEHQFKLVMLRQNHLAEAKRMIDEKNSQVLLGTVIDFPLGQSSCKDKLKEIQCAINSQADDIDVVVDYNRFKDGHISDIKQQVFECTKLCLNNGKTIKWIIESGALTDEEIINICYLIKDTVIQNFGVKSAHMVFVKSSTGFHSLPNGQCSGATLDSIRLMLKHAWPLAVKASGGIRNYQDFEAIISAGVKRVGTSSALKIVQGESTITDY